MEEKVKCPGLEIFDVDVRETMDPDIKKLIVHGKEKLIGSGDLPIWATESDVEIRDCVPIENGFKCSVWMDDDWNQFIKLKEVMT